MSLGAHFEAAPTMQSTGGDTMADYVSAAMASYTGQLIAPRAFQKIQRVAGLFPGALTDFFGFECALGSDQASADFLVCCRSRHGAREILAGRKFPMNLPSILETHSVWRRIRTFSKEWAKPGSAVHEAVHNLWFEFDMDDPGPEVPVPNVFIGSDRLRRFSQCDDQETANECAWLTDLAMPILLGEEVNAPVRRQVVGCLARLPEGARVFQVGWMVARESRSTRLCIRGIATSEIEAYLGAIEWQGNWRAFEDLLDALESKVERIDLALDVTDRVSPKIGLECYLDAEESRLDAFLDHLVSSELCTGCEAAAIAVWTGTVHVPQTGEILWGSRRRNGCFESRFARQVHHVKVDCREVEAPRAKAYLGVHHTWLATERISAPSNC